MKTVELKELSVEDIQQKILAEKNNLADLKLSHVVSPLDNPFQIKKVRKDIARLKTELNKR